MRLSVIIPVYNVERWLLACLESVLIAANGRAAEVICVDDGSTDASPEILARYPVTVITQPNAGYGAAVNAGMDAAKGDYIAIVEPDDRVTPTAWDQSLALLEADADADLTRAPYLAERRWRRASDIGLANPPDGVFTAYEHPDLLDLPPAIWSCVYRRSALGRLRLPETPGAAFQDTYFSMMLLLSGARAKWADKPFYRYRADRPGASRDGRRRTDEVLRVHDMVLRDLPPEAQAHPDFTTLFYAAYFRRLVWFFERVTPGFQEEAFRQAYLQFCSVWRDRTLSARIAARLSKHQRRVFDGFANGRIDAFSGTFGLARPTPKAPAPEGDFNLFEIVRSDLGDLLPRPLAGALARVALRPVAWAVAAAVRSRLRAGPDA